MMQALGVIVLKLFSWQHTLSQKARMFVLGRKDSLVQGKLKGEVSLYH
jgi:hypothetical protein